MNKFTKVLILVVASLALLVFVAPQTINQAAQKLHILKVNIPNRSFRLGLDLLGGTHLVYQADLSKVATSASDAMQGVRDVVERRVNLFGVSEPVVQVSGSDRLIVDLAGINDVNQAIQLIGQTPFLEFKILLPSVQGDAIIKKALGNDTQGLTATALCTPANGLTLNQFLITFGVDPCYQPSGLNGSGLKTAQVSFNNQSLSPQVSLELNTEGAKLLGRLPKLTLARPWPSI